MKNSPEKIESAKLPDRLGKENLVFVGRCSYEDRSYTAYRQLKNCNLVQQYFFVSKHESDTAKQLREKENLRTNIRVLDTHDPLQTRREISSVFSLVRSLNNESLLVVDITAFRREELLILLKFILCGDSRLQSKTRFVYSSAKSMGKWLSKNVRGFRPVIGYPGEIRASGRTHLIILAGIEHHRVEAAIEVYEPASISLGTSPLQESVSDEIHHRNIALRDYITARFERIQSEFSFSATNPRQVKSALSNEIRGQLDKNIVIAPLNTKLSTIGVGAFAIENPSIQLCYSEVEVYNTMNYSEASGFLYLLAPPVLLED